MKTFVKVLLGCVLSAVLVYVYYTEIKPVVIFGLRSDYAHAIPFQKIPEGLTSLKAESCGECHREIYDEWAACSHFTMYDDVPDVLRSLHASGVKLGLISNSHRCLASFEAHFELRGLFAVTVSSIEHGYMKPHRSIFEAALSGADVSASESIMVGDSLTHDVDGARRLGMRGVLVARSGPTAAPPDVPVIQSLRELPALL